VVLFDGTMGSMYLNLLMFLVPAGGAMAARGVIFADAGARL
jgi:hypothetical protein